jgi:transforming growth factor-beta-induced protein
LAEALTGEGPLTVFAPNDKAFAALPAGTVESLLKPENKDQLVAILKYHVVSGRVYSSDVLGSTEIETLNGSAITPAMVDGNATVSGASLVATDVDASNGVIHIIDAVMMPPKSGETHQPVSYMKHVCPSTGNVTYTIVPGTCNK